MTFNKKYDKTDTELVVFNLRRKALHTMTDTSSTLLTPEELRAFLAGNSVLQRSVENSLVSGIVKGPDLAVFVRNIGKTGDDVLKALENRRRELNREPLTFPRWVMECVTIFRGVESNLRRGPAEDPDELSAEVRRQLREKPVWEIDESPDAWETRYHH